jgi:hypothetical protein
MGVAVFSNNVEGACGHCSYAPLLDAANVLHASQPQFRKMTDGNEAWSMTPLDMPQPERDALIESPTKLTRDVEANLREHPCKFTQTGLCQLAKFIIHSSANQRLE